MSKTYVETKRFWIKYWGIKPDYAYVTNSAGYTDRTKRIIGLYADKFNGSNSFCELGVGSGRNIYYFHKRFPHWKFSGNDIYPEICQVIETVYPEVLEFTDITIADTLEYLKECNHSDIIFSHGHLMHIPDSVIKDVCGLMAKKANKFILIHEAYPCTSDSVKRKQYRFERDYLELFPEFSIADAELEITRSQGLKYVLGLFERIVS